MTTVMAVIIIKVVKIKHGMMSWLCERKAELIKIATDSDDDSGILITEIPDFICSAII